MDFILFENLGKVSFIKILFFGLINFLKFICLDIILFLWSY